MTRPRAGAAVAVVGSATRNEDPNGFDPPGGVVADTCCAVGSMVGALTGSSAIVVVVGSVAGGLVAVGSVVVGLVAVGLEADRAGSMIGLGAGAGVSVGGSTFSSKGANGPPLAGAGPRGAVAAGAAPGAELRGAVVALPAPGAAARVLSTAARSASKCAAGCNTSHCVGGGLGVKYTLVALR